jgi:ribosomal protein S6
MRNYELTCLISPELKEEEVKELAEKTTDFLKEKAPIEIEAIKKIKFGYPIKKKGEAFLLILNFQAETNEIKNLEKRLKENSSFLRYTILQRKVTALVKKPRIVKIKGVKTLPKIKKEKEKKVELKEIEKKLEEILSEKPLK